MTAIDPRISKAIDHVLANEGGYVNHPNDPGGATNYGITAAVARANGYAGPMKDLPKTLARQIYFNRYVVEPRYDAVLALAPDVALELIDSGVNAGTRRASEWLQRALNLANRGHKDWADIGVDGHIGGQTLAALKAFLGKRNASILVKLIEGYQAMHYIQLAERNPKFEDFIIGWFDTRIRNVA